MRQAQASIDAAAAADRYNREYQAIEAINLSVATLLSDVAYYLMIEDSHKKFPEEISLVFLHQSRKDLMVNTNKGSVSTLLALPQIHDEELQELAVKVHEAMSAVRAEFDGSDPDIKEVSWQNAFEKSTPMNHANRNLQAAALGYFAKKEEPTQTDSPTAK
ncbi:hypothetical protein [Rhodococcoides kyotonense]|uniref:hypothetical protein n=1 Tax=Rhodococcoides kyotonense TaxID=398843 RepID=UPI000B78CF44|nr:hypothetical protein [Rhodococcus kyotonensis]